MLVLPLTSRGTRRRVIPKSWPMPRLKDHRAAARQAPEEAGIVGRTEREPMGSYVSWKRQSGRFVLCRVFVYRLEFETLSGELAREGERQRRWFPVDDAADQVNEPVPGTPIRRLAGPPADEAA